MRIDARAEKIIKLMNGAGEKAYCVGGCVRDFLLGKEPHDFDICTSAEPMRTKEILKDFPVIETGLKHGTVTVIADGEPIEVTTWRIDGKYADNRRPENVTFTKSLEEDLRRRDFTINAIAFDGETVIDPFGGRKDLEDGIIRAVGDPYARVEEDALRILRGLRFSSVFGFGIEEKTAAAIRERRELLKNISAERVFSELKLILCGKNATDILLGFPEIIGTVIPEITPTFGFEQHNKHHIYDVYTHTAVSVGKIAPDPILRLTMLFHDIGKPRAYFFENGEGHFWGHPEISVGIARDVLNRLKCDNETKDAVLTLIRYHDDRFPPERRSIKRMLSRIGKENYALLMKVKRADTDAQSDYEKEEKYAQTDALEALAEQIEKENECFSLSQLAVNGNDLKNFFSGRQIGEALRMCLSAVIDGAVKNEKNALLAFVKENTDKIGSE